MYPHIHAHIYVYIYIYFFLIIYVYVFLCPPLLLHTIHILRAAHVHIQLAAPHFLKRDGLKFPTCAMVKTPYKRFIQGI